MNPQEALTVLDNVSQQIPMVHSDQERVGASLLILQRSLAGEPITEASPLDAITVLDHVAKSVPLVRADYMASRQAVYVLQSHFAPQDEAESQPEEATTKPRRSRSRKK